MVEVDNRPWGPRPVEMININKIQTEAEVVPSSSLVEVMVEVEVGVEVEIGARLRLELRLRLGLRLRVIVKKSS